MISVPCTHASDALQFLLFHQNLYVSIPSAVSDVMGQVWPKTMAFLGLGFTFFRPEPSTFKGLGLVWLKPMAYGNFFWLGLSPGHGFTLKK